MVATVEAEDPDGSDADLRYIFYNYYRSKFLISEAVSIIHCVLPSVGPSIDNGILCSYALKRLLTVNSIICILSNYLPVYMISCFG